MSVLLELQLTYVATYLLNRSCFVREVGPYRTVVKVGEEQDILGDPLGRVRSGGREEGRGTYKVQ